MARPRGYMHNCMHKINIGLTLRGAGMKHRSNHPPMCDISTFSLGVASARISE
jgi:hypothetical protein